MSIVKWLAKQIVVYSYNAVFLEIKKNKLLLLLLSHFSCVWLCATPETAAHQASPSLDSPGKNTGVGCHFLLQCMKVKRESEVAHSCPTLSDPMDCSLPGSSIRGIFQARVPEWGAIAFSQNKLLIYTKSNMNLRELYWEARQKAYIYCTICMTI